MHKLVKDEKKRKPWLLPGLAVILVFFYYYFYLRPIRLESEARKIIGCWNEAKFGCVASFIPDSELAAYSLSREQAAAVLEIYCAPILVGDAKLDKIAFTQQSMGLAFDATDSTGKGSHFAGLVVRSEKETKCANFLSGLLLECAQKRYRNGLNQSDPAVEFEAFLKQCTLDRGQLEALGVPGILRTAKITPWSQWEQICRRVIAQRNKNFAGSSSGG